MTSAFHGSLIADAFAMPVHWYYDRDALDDDYPELNDFRAPLPHHSGSILWRSSYEPPNEKGDILHDQARFWGQRGIHYHQNLKAGENTVNFKLARELHHQVTTQKAYSEDEWLQLFISRMLTPGWHRDTYLEEYHRGFFTSYAQGKPPRKCGIKDEHIGGLAQVPALVAALDGHPREDTRQYVKNHVALTHRHSNVLRAADCLTRLLLDLANGLELREAIMQSAGDWFSTKKASKWSQRPDRVIIGKILSPACYIDQSFPAALYLAWKYHESFTEAITANALVGGDSCHRGAVVGSLVGLSHPEEVTQWAAKLATYP
ncbi:ADP-ribosylglycohydrolase family protein [Akkermansiaceae bacterium]|nr:ADP-ribosylglycohydrolase family protein [Akkermansiaceae bacterium]MDB4537804.1 ADP-ribosylglycohydrolase family protein [Akkermansiaceae bacterium]